MASSTINLLLSSLLFLTLATSSSSFNVTTLLGPLPQFSTFSNYLAQVGLVEILADLNSVTILAVPNSKMASISGKSRDEIKRIMSMHVIPEYYDLDGLKKKAPLNGAASIRTVYVLTGLARGKDGILLVTQRQRANFHRFTFSSAVRSRSDPDRVNHVSLVQSVVVPSHNVSVFHVSDLIASPPPPPAVTAGFGGGFGRLAVSGKVEMRQSFVAEVKRGRKAEVKEFDGEDSIFANLKAGSATPPAKAPASGGSGSGGGSSPKKSPSKAPAPSKPSNSTSGEKGKSPSSAPVPSPPRASAPAPAPTKKTSNGTAPAPAKVTPSTPPPAKAQESEPSPGGSSEKSPTPSESESTPPSPPAPQSPTNASSAPPSGDVPLKPSPPAPATVTPGAESPAVVEAPAPTNGGDAPMKVTGVGLFATVMAMWALAA